MRIVLLRHGKPDTPAPKPQRVKDFHLWIKSYNTANLRKDSNPPRTIMGILNDLALVVCSDLPRSKESAQKLGFSQVDYAEPLFREMAMPYASFPSPKLSPNVWAILFRIMWFLGYSPNSESFSEAKLRAVSAANRLKELAHNNGSVLFVGHGLINAYIAKALLSEGWQGPASPGKKYWEFGVYECAT